jgi:hypothetical protein
MPLGSPTLGNPDTVGGLVARIQQDLRGETYEPFDVLASDIAEPTGVTETEEFDRSDRVLNDNGWIPYGIYPVGTSTSDVDRYMQIVGQRATMALEGAGYAARRIPGLREFTISYRFPAGTDGLNGIGAVVSDQLPNSGIINIGINSVHHGLYTTARQTHVYDGAVRDEEGEVIPALDTDTYAALGADTDVTFRCVWDPDLPDQVTVYDQDGSSEVISDPAIAEHWGETLYVEVINLDDTDRIPSINYVSWIGDEGFGYADATGTLVSGIPEIGEGGLVAIDEETLLVKAVNGLSVTLARGINGSKIAGHSEGSIVEVNPRFFPAVIGSAIVEEIRSWPPDMYRVETADVAFGSTELATEFSPSTAFRTLLEATWYSSYADHYSTLATMPRITRSADTDVYGSGYSIQRYGPDFDSGTLRVVYATDFDLDSLELDSALADIGIPASSYDVVIYGVLWRLLAPREAGRLNTLSQPQPRAKQDVPARATLSAAAGYKQLRDERLAEEILRLKEYYRPGGA